MAKKTLHKSKRIPRANWFDLGGATDLGGIKLGSGGAGGSIGMQGSGGIVNTLSGRQKLQASLGLGTGNLGQAISGMSGVGGIANGAANMINGLMNPSGNETGVGNALSAVGSLASNIPGVGGIIGAGVNLVGGLFNAAFGSNINEEFVNQTKDQAKEQGNYVSGATDNASLLSDWGSYTDMAHVSQSDVGSDGWFSNKAKNLTKKLNKQIDEANFRAWNSLSNTAGNIDTQNDMNALANFSAYGGPLEFMGGAIDYELANRDLQNKQLKALGDMRMTSIPNYGDGLPKMPIVQTFAEGGGIHIKKKNRGKFTSYCGGKVTSECIARGKRSSSPTIRKRATFAANARKWKHADGGPLLTQGGIWSNGVTFIDNGGTHEQNPYDGVQMGVDNQGIPNLVEQGEVVWNDYVFSNRLKPSKEMKKKNKYKGTTFADIAKNIQKESEERPNDWISRNGLDVSLSRLAILQEGIRKRKAGNKFNKGGKLNPYSNYTTLTDDSFYTPEYMNFWNWINNNRSDSRAQRWLDRINSEEFGTVGGNIFNFDDIVRLAHDYKRGPVHNAFALAAREFTNSDDNPNINRNNLRFTPDNWELLPEDLEELRDIKLDSPKLDSPKTDNTTDTVDTSWEYSPLRYAPIVGNGLAVLSDIFSKPDYSAADRVEGVNVIPAMVGYNPVGNYLSYKPFDRDFYINKLNASANATRRALQNTSGGNRAAAMAGLLAADYNYGNQLGDLARQAEEYNQQLRERVEGFNRQTNLANAEMGLKASMANAESRNKATQLRLNQAGTVAAMRQAARDAYDTRRSTNLNNLLTDLAGLGTEITNRRWLDSLAKAGVLAIDSNGNFIGRKNSKGGKLKKKGGWKYA